MDFTNAVCRDVDPELFFPVSDADQATITAARAICARCPIKADCLAWALENLPVGVAGGTTDQERRALRATR